MSCPNEKTLAELVKGLLRSEEAAEVRRHLEECQACRDAANALMKPPVVLKAGAQLGKYMVLERISAEGRVYAAYDPDRDCRCAIKLNASGTPELLKLKHANVVCVLEVGSFEGQSFRALEYVKGQSLAQWLKAKRRTWREVLALFRQAGKGLQAAHQRHLVHGAFRPEHVLIDERGRARVIHFALVSQTGAYAAPEQLSDGKVDARSDVYSFCVSLYEALYGELPVASLAEDRPSPRASEVPPWLTRIVRRGLAASPDQRPASMAELLRALEHDPQTLRRRAIVATVVVVVVAVAAGYAATVKQKARQVCLGSEQRMTGVWDEAVALRIHKAFVRSRLSYAEQSFASLKRLLDLHAGNWISAHREACEVTRIRHVESEETYVKSNACLERRLVEMKALTDVLPVSDPAWAVQSTSMLDPVDGCTEAVFELRPRLAEVQALHSAGVFQEALEKSRALLEEGKHAETLFIAGQLEASMGDLARAETLLNDAAWSAMGNREDDLVAKALILEMAVRTKLGRTEDALSLEKPCRGAIQRLGNPQALTASLLTQLGIIRTEQGKFAEAVELYRKAVEVQPERLLGRYHLGTTLLELGKVAEAILELQKSKEFLGATLGAQHPDTLLPSNALAEAYRRIGEPEKAKLERERALQLEVETYGNNHARVGAQLTGLAEVMLDLGENVGAEERARKALAILERTKEKPFDARDVLARALERQGRADEAIQEYQALIDLWKATPDSTQKLSAPYSGIARALLSKKLPRLALWAAEEAHKALEGSTVDAADRAEVNLLLARALWDSKADRRRARALVQDLEGLVSATPPARVAAMRPALDALIDEMSPERGRSRATY
ncbi:MAG: protein kinase domain-containing protein [Myxococcaceae bacterium]